MNSQVRTKDVGGSALLHLDTFTDESCLSVSVCLVSVCLSVCLLQLNVLPNLVARGADHQEALRVRCRFQEKVGPSWRPLVVK